MTKINILAQILGLILISKASLAHTGQCPESLEKANATYHESSEFKEALVQAIQNQVDIPLKTVKVIETFDIAGDAYAGLLRDLVPHGLELLGDNNSSGQERDFSFHVSVIDETGKNLYVRLRSDNWNLCHNGQALQSRVSVEGFVYSENPKKYWTIHFIWDLANKKASGPLDGAPLLTCRNNYEITFYKTEDKGRYHFLFLLGESGHFAMENCQLQTNSSMSCSTGIHKAQFSWIGLEPQRPDKIKFEISGTNASGKEQVLISNELICEAK